MNTLEKILDILERYEEEYEWGGEEDEHGDLECGECNFWELKRDIADVLIKADTNE